MKQTTLSQIDSPLLNFAITKLDPEIFSHPVWLRFGKKDISASLKIVDDLLSAARNLQEKDLSGACQVLLICAIYQNQTGQSHKASRVVQQALFLAEQAGLAREMVWAMWGMCAICFQQQNYEQANNYLVDLHAALRKQNEWILADFVDVIRESLMKYPADGQSSQFKSEGKGISGNLISYAFDWLWSWGFSTQTIKSQYDVDLFDSARHPAEQSTLTQSFFSVQRWQGHWHSLMLMFKSELKLQWVKNTPHPAKKHFSLFGSILSTLRLYLSGRNIDNQVLENAPLIPRLPLLPPVNIIPPGDTTISKRKSTSENKKGNTNPTSKPDEIVLPMAVQMFGSFGLTLQDVTLKIPASRGLSLFKYLLMHHKQTIPREVLMDIFWPDADPETARNSLNVALHGLRRALRNVLDLPVILFKDGAYGLASNLQIWLDVEEFERCVKAGQRLEARDQFTAALAEYESAISLYQADFLEQNPYEEWTVLDRERLRITYLDTLDRLSQIYFSQERYAACITVGQLILARDRCREDAHCLLMRCYNRQGQHYMALRQYQSCVEALRAELEVEPALETTRLYEQIRRRERVEPPQNHLI